MRVTRDIATLVYWVAVAAFTATTVSLSAQTLASDNTPSFLADTRLLAVHGRRAEALARLQSHLAEEPNDVDARLLFGTVLSWERRYDEAREQLQRVLSDHPNYTDARTALINVEMWSGHPVAAEVIIREALERDANDLQLLLALARAQRAEQRQREALLTLDHLLKREPGNQLGRTMRRDIREESFVWKATVSHEVDWFSKSLASQQESYISLARETGRGSVIGRLSRADRFRNSSYQGEIDLYPSIRPGTYGYLNFGYSDGVLYPRYRMGADLFHNFAYGIEASAGYRRLRFSDSINIFTGSVGKYYGNWFFNLRPYFTPDLGGTSKSVTATARRYFGSTGQFDYFGFGYGYGASLQPRSVLDFEVLKSSSFYSEVNKAHGHWAGQLHLGIKREDFTFQSAVRHYIASGNLYYRF